MASLSSSLKIATYVKKFDENILEFCVAFHVSVLNDCCQVRSCELLVRNPVLNYRKTRYGDLGITSAHFHKSNLVLSP